MKRFNKKALLIVGAVFALIQVAGAEPAGAGGRVDRPRSKAQIRRDLKALTYLRDHQKAPAMPGAADAFNRSLHKSMASIEQSRVQGLQGCIELLEEELANAKEFARNRDKVERREKCFGSNFPRSSPAYRKAQGR